MAWQQLLAEGIRDTVGHFTTYLQNKRNYRHYQKRIQNTVADARKAGIHPLAAMGVAMGSPPPVEVFEMGHDGSRALAATMTPAERRLNKRLKTATVEEAEADADLAKLTVRDYQDRITKPIPSEVEKPSETTKSISIDAPHVEAGTPAELKFYDTATGGLGSSVSSDLKELVEDSPDEITLTAKRMLFNLFGSKAYKPPKEIWKKKYPKARDMRFSLATWDWQPVYRSDGGNPKTITDRFKRVMFPSEKKPK